MSWVNVVAEPIRSAPSSASVIPAAPPDYEYQQYGDNGHCDGEAVSVRHATGEQFGLRVVSQQVDGIGKGCCAMVRSKIKHDVILKSILPDGILHIIVLALAAVY